MTNGWMDCQPFAPTPCVFVVSQALQSELEVRGSEAAAELARQREMFKGAMGQSDKLAQEELDKRIAVCPVTAPSISSLFEALLVQGSPGISQQLCQGPSF